MTDTTALPRMRSWLFAPGDSEKKMDKAIASEADIALLDLEDFRGAVVGRMLSQVLPGSIHERVIAAASQSLRSCLVCEILR